MVAWGGLIRILTCIMLGCPLVIHSAEIEGRVIGVTDGDTITLLDEKQQQHKIRLSGIDAPESSQAFGQASKRNLSKMVFDHAVVADCRKADRYRRQVCKVIVGGVDANIEQIKSGMAWWYRKYAREQPPSERSDYEAAEEGAKAARKGLWRDTDPIPPWDWRRR